METGIDLESLMTREQIAEALTAAGFPTKAKTLATKATRGGGPPYRRYDARALYRWGDALEWAKSRLTPLIFSTSDPNAHRRTVTEDSVSRSNARLSSEQTP